MTIAKRKARRGEAATFFEQVVLPCQSDGCLAWPFAVTVKGYGVMQFCGRLTSVHRLACEIVHGTAPASNMEAAHSCGNGHYGCVNPRHVRWATRAQNAADRDQHGRTASGERNGSAKLTNQQARDIAELVSSPTRESYSKIARRFGVSIYPVYSIAKKLNWAPTIGEVQP